MKLVCFIVFFAGLCHGVSEATECTSRGRFPNNDAEDCRGFTMCLLGGAASFTQYKLTCPPGFIYSHLEQQCTNSTSYHCLPTYPCNVTGNFEDPSSKNCSSYIACIEGVTGIVTARLIECSIGKVFNPETSACVDSASYVCPVGITTTEVVVTEIPVPTSSLPLPQNTSYNVSISVDDGLSVVGRVSTNSALEVCNKHTVLFALFMFVCFHM